MFFKVQKSIKNYVFHEKLLIQNLCGFFQAIKIMTEKYWFTNYSTLDKVNYKLNMTFINDWNHYSKPKNSKSFFEEEITKVWKLHNFHVTQILREINFRNSRSAKSAIFAIIEALNFDFLEFWPFWRLKTTIRSKLESVKKSKTIS